MASSYADAIEHLYALGQELAPAPPLADGTPAPRRKFDLEYMRVLCGAMGDPQSRFPSVLIAGTNGKGSTAATLASIVAAAGYKTALYTSPHLIRVNERIQILGGEGAERGSGLRTPVPFPVPIDDDSFARLYVRVDDTAAALVADGSLPHGPSFFEVLTALAFLYFAEQEVELAVLEVGLGGRLDATNIVDPLVSVLTDIALDHQDYLGDTITAITREKAGILRPNGVLVTLPQHPEANQAIGEAAASLNLRARSAADFVPAREAVLSETASPLGSNRYSLMVEGEPLEVDSPLAGQHQQRNIALAIATALELRHLSGVGRNDGGQAGYAIPVEAIAAGIRATRWPGRLELVAPDLLLDVAHNPAGTWTLRAAIAQLPEERPRTLIFSCLRDKSLTEMSRILFPLFDATGGRPQDHIVLAPIANPRAAAVEELAAAAAALDVPAQAATDLAGALALARRITPAGGLIVATGSVYLVGEIRQLAVSA
ncbi:MAG TPA: folylpolyglutamate synthase/dihydrofolate synthase family protein [Granulicella sp.]|jgi:dihydrofolate synthase/folylpolyglutamate synthase|nr:folylpolyglutamate synthase/dihydrofolate synthase family protein [Granulicella sp.]